MNDKNNQLQELEKKKVKNRLSIPDHIVKKVLKNFGVDEAIAWVFNIWWTAILSAWARETLSHTQKNLLYTIGWPVIEKFWLFVRHIRLARKKRNSTPLHERKPIIFYAREIMAWGSESLLKDVLFHDPIYWVFMYLWLQANDSTNPTIISFVSFFLAIFAVAGIERWYDEAKYVFIQSQLKKQWFSLESYHESRLFNTKNIHADAILNCLQDPFGLHEFTQRAYEDTYFMPKEKMTWGRYTAARIRKRQCLNDLSDPQVSTQYIFTKPSLMTLKELDEINYFSISKDKWYHTGEVVNRLDKWVKPNQSREWIAFIRTLWRNSNGLLVAIDTDDKEENNTVELKVHQGNEELLIWAIALLKETFPGFKQSTESKQEARRI